jgi:S-adenosylmethionine hydrolase
MTRFDTISSFTDLGRNDETVGVIRSILRELSPGSVTVDVCHEIQPGDTRAAALMLARSVPYLAPGIVLVSVGQRLDRPAIAVEVGDGQAALVGPDNGVLAAAVAVVGGADRAVALTNEDLHLASPGAVHPARDIIGPVVGHLAAGAPFESLGDLIDPGLLLPSLVPVPRIEDDGAVAAEVLLVDRLDSAQLNIDREALAGSGDIFVLEFGEERRVVRLADPGSHPGSQAALVDDVHGLLAVVAPEGVTQMGLSVGTEVTIREAR